MSIRIAVADDHNLIRSGIVDMLRSNPLFEIAGEAAKGIELIDIYEEQRPDLMLVDIAMPDMSGIEAVRTIRSKHPDARALFISMYCTEEYIYSVLLIGGNGLLSKSIEKLELFKAIEKVSSGEDYYGKYTITELENIEDKFEGVKYTLINDYQDLTEREKKILLMISDGLTSKEIARALNLGKRTIDSHRLHLIQKLDLKSLPELVRFAIQYSNLNKKQ